MSILLKMPLDPLIHIPLHLQCRQQEWHIGDMPLPLFLSSLPSPSYSLLLHLQTFRRVMNTLWPHQMMNRRINQIHLFSGGSLDWALSWYWQEVSLLGMFIHHTGHYIWIKEEADVRLTLALMGSDDLNLRVLATSSDDPAERKQAGKVLKLLAKGRHWVLVVLLLSNVVRHSLSPWVELIDRSSMSLYLSSWMMSSEEVWEPS